LENSLGLVWPQQLKPNPCRLCIVGRVIHWFAVAVSVNLAVLAVLFAIFPDQFFDRQVAHTFAGLFGAVAIVMFLVGRAARYLVGGE
jgi:hypothetical protein